MTAPDRAALGERAARALQSALGEPLAKVLERVTALLVAVQEEEREACEIIVDEHRLKQLELMDEESDCEFKEIYEHAASMLGYALEAIGERALDDVDDGARGTESKTGGR